MNTIDWSKFVDIKYWLDGVAGNTSITPVIERGSLFFWFFLYLFSSLLILGIALRLVQAFLHTNHPLQNKLPFWGNNFTWMGILGLTWFTLRQLNTAFLGARFWLIVGIVWFSIIIYFIIRYFIVFYKLEYSYFKKTFLNQESK